MGSRSRTRSRTRSSKHLGVTSRKKEWYISTWIRHLYNSLCTLLTVIIINPRHNIPKYLSHKSTSPPNILLLEHFNMTRGDKPATRVHYKGDHNDFVIFAESPEIVCRWKKDRSIPLMEVVDSFHVFTTYVPNPNPSPKSNSRRQCAEVYPRIIGGIKVPKATLKKPPA